MIELGHSIHDLVARTKFATHHGFQVTLELGEGIGMMLEQWCWLSNEMKAMSLHYTRIDATHMEAWLKDNPGLDLPPERIPDSLLEPHLTRRGHAKVDRLLGILSVILPFRTTQTHRVDFEFSVDAIFDMAVHNPASHEGLLQLDEVKLYREIVERLTFRPLPDLSNRHVSSGHLLAGYDAGYYSYVWYLLSSSL